ncbi:thioredoxin family protein [Dissulfurirhabdus thermomarina]|uniref:Thioredoxin family protein n=2 Tax=Dissulfurirhabdus thermomarina TaxID=1765737 RepID=A0A6N9TP88_DISTH|nr:thioredoxin family protein [Dissulfurirhabdus thermomarina]NDY43092.1 thioredoxin family protein [Dissulfurirhabdus thermomarina]NMX22691.1 thioredoxin family protein [Dissulfurirhabdus thermomarina]
MKVRIVHIEGCPATPPTRDLVRRVAGELGLDVELEDVTVTTAAEAERYRFIGSPTVQVEGRDIEPGAEAVTAYAVT